MTTGWRGRLGRVSGAPVALAGLLWSGGAMAAPFCITSEALPPQCIYVDPTLCQRDAQHLRNAECTVNRNEVRVRPGIGHYCMVTADRVSFCNYQNYDSCQADANRHNAACTAAPNPTPNRPPDPYARY
jgi:hypothetical protein